MEVGQLVSVYKRALSFLRGNIKCSVYAHCMCNCMNAPSYIFTILHYEDKQPVLHNYFSLKHIVLFLEEQNAESVSE